MSTADIVVVIILVLATAFMFFIFGSAWRDNKLNAEHEQREKEREYNILLNDVRNLKFDVRRVKDRLKMDEEPSAVPPR